MKTRANALFSLAGLVLMSGALAPSCATSIKERAAYDPAKEAGPRPVKNEAAHVELKLSAYMVRPGQPIRATAYGRGDLKGGWLCVFLLWRSDESGWQPMGTEPGAQCGDVAETWVWTKGPYRFITPGEHEVCVAVHDRNGKLVGLRPACARVDVVRTE